MGRWVRGGDVQRWRDGPGGGLGRKDDPKKKKKEGKKGGIS